MLKFDKNDLHTVIWFHMFLFNTDTKTDIIMNNNKKWNSYF